MMYAVGALILNKNGELLVLHHKNLSAWTVPSGKAEYPESVVEATTREVKEEVGLDTFDVALMHAEVYQNLPLFLCSVGNYTGDASNKEPDKHYEIRWVKIEDLEKLSPRSRFLQIVCDMCV